jgi:hypothetical protein
MRLNQITKSAQTILTAVAVTAGAVIPGFGQIAMADTMSSSSYRIEADVMSIGGNRSTSNSYTLEDTIGEMATGEDLSSASFLGCAGYHCFVGDEYITFSVTEGLTAPGTAGAGVNLDVLSVSQVTGSNGSDVNSIFLTAESTARGGAVIRVAGGNGGLASLSVPTDLIPSATATLVSGTEGFGVCVESSTEGQESPSTLEIATPYDGTCNKTTGHDVGILSLLGQNILTTSGAMADGSAEILVKAAIANESPAHDDYVENITFTMTGTF